MANQVIIYYSCECLPCANSYPANVALCVTPSKLAANDVPEPEREFHTLSAILTNVVNGCKGGPNKYEFTYDDEDIAEGQTLLTTDILGIVCLGCLEDWISDIVNPPPDPFVLCVTDSSSIDFSITGGGCVTGSVIISAEPDNTLELAVDGLYVPPGGGGGDDWHITGNSGTVDGTNFLGTTDNVPFNIRVNNFRAARFQGNSANVPDVILGDPAHVIDSTPGNGNGIFAGGASNLGALTIRDSIECVLVGSHFGTFGEILDSNVCGMYSGDTCTIELAQTCAIVGAVQSTIEAGLIYGSAFYSAIVSGGGHYIDGDNCFIAAGDNGTIVGEVGNAIIAGDNNDITNGTNCVALGSTDCTITNGDNSIVMGRSLSVGTHTFAFNGDDVTGAGIIDLNAFDSATNGLIYLGGDVWIGNANNSANKLLFWEPNTDVDFSSAHYSSFRAQAQGANIEYIWPAAAGVAGNSLKIQSVVGTTVTLEWAA